MFARLIDPQNSYAELEIAREPLLKLLSETHRSPFILDLLHTYGAKESPENENFPIYEEDSVANGNFLSFKYKIKSSLKTIIEIVYNLKYVYCRPDVTDKGKMVWSTRKIGISAQERSWIVLQAPSQFQELLRTVVGSSSWPEDQCNIHLLAHETCNGSWNPYLNYLERQINELVRECRLPNSDLQC